MEIYIDNECKCHVSNPDGIYTEIEAPESFHGKCPAYIEGFRVRPAGYTYTFNGEIFGPDGLSASPWRDLALLEEFQAQYENERLKTRVVELEAQNEMLMQCVLEMSEIVYA